MAFDHFVSTPELHIVAMSKVAIKAVEDAANRLLTLSSQITYGEESYNKGLARWNPKLTGELRRASLDLTRRLAEMRKY